MAQADEQDNEAHKSSHNCQLLTAFNSFAEQNTEIASSVRCSLDTVAQGITSISSTIQANLPLSTVSARVQPSRSCCGCSHKNSDVELPCNQRRWVRAGDLSAAVRLHCATLFGRCAHKGQLPEPATAEQKREWIHRVGKESISLSESNADNA